MTDFLNLQWQGQLSEAITAIATTPTGWAASSAAGEVVCWQNDQLTHYQTAGDFSIDCLSYAADGQYLAAAGQAGQVKIWCAGENWQIISAQRVWIDRLAWHPTLPILAIAIGKQVQIWQIADRQLIATLPFDRSTVADLCWQFDGSQLAVAGYGGVAVWTWGNWQQYELLAVETSVHQVAWSSDGQFLAAATLDRQLIIATSSELERPWLIPDLPAKIRQMQWFARESILAIVTNQELICWQYADDNWHPQAAQFHAPPVMGISLHPQLSIAASLITVGQNNQVISIQDPDLVILAQVAAQINSSEQSLLQWSRAGTQLIIGCRSGQISCWSGEL
jgi:WD40 repeat protein